MKKVIFLVFVGIAAFALSASRDYELIEKQLNMVVDTDSFGDSTYGSFINRLAFVKGFSNSAMVQVVIGVPTPPYVGLGEKDSAFLQLRTSFAGVTTVLTADTCNDLPCSLYWTSITDIDTLLKEDLSILCSIFDTLGDTTITVTYPIKFDIILK